MKTLSLTMIIIINSIACLVAAQDKLIDESLSKPTRAIDEVEETQEKDVQEATEVNQARPVKKKKMVANNPIAPAGVSISEFLEYGMVHVEDPNLLLEEKGQGEGSGQSNPAEKIRRFYVHHIAAGNPNKGHGRDGVAESTIEILIPDEEINEADEEDGPEDLEEETDLSKLASRHKRG